jgi:AcrR family transcriptional regulator
MTAGEPAGREGASRPGLTEERIVTAAIEAIESKGVEALSMRRIAADLGVAAMSLYYHVPNKAALLDAVAERIVSGLDVTDDPELSAEDRARRLMRSFRKAAHDHPRCIQLVLTRGADSPATLRLVEQTLTIARAAGFEGVQAVRMAGAFVSYVLGSLVRETGMIRALRNLPSGVDLRPWLETLDPAAYPSLASLAAEGFAFDFEADFEYGLDLMLAGVRKGAPPGPPGR